MSIEFDSNQPIYLQIMADIKRRLITGELAPGGKVEPVRELALLYGVNPNTAQKALAELERAGLLYSDRSAGRLATEDAELIARLKEEEINAVISAFVKRMEALGAPPAEKLAEYLSDAKQDRLYKGGFA